MPRVNALIEGLVHSTVVDQYRFLFAGYVSVNRKYGLGGLDLKAYSAALNCCVFPSIKLTSETIKDKVGDGRFAGAVFSSNDVHAVIKALVVTKSVEI